MIEFAWPYIFLLIPLPWIIYKFLPASHQNENVALRIPEFNDFTHFNSASSSSLPKLKTLFAFLIWVALLTSAARPQWIGTTVELPQNGRDLMLAVDLSGSMQINDFEIKGQFVDRLSALKFIASDFIDKRKGDRIGLILFGTHVYLHTPLTFDLATVKQLLMETEVGFAGNDTAIGDAIGLAVKHLRDSSQESRVLILLTDGNNNAGKLTLERAAELASNATLKVHTVAIGSESMVMQTIFGAQTVNPSSNIDEKSLKMIAEKTGGNYFRAHNTKELVQIYQKIDQLETKEQAAKTYRPIHEMYYWPLLVALACSAILIIYKLIFK